MFQFSGSKIPDFISTVLFLPIQLLVLRWKIAILQLKSLFLNKKLIISYQKILIWKETLNGTVLWVLLGCKMTWCCRKSIWIQELIRSWVMTTFKIRWIVNFCNECLIKHSNKIRNLAYTLFSLLLFTWIICVCFFMFFYVFQFFSSFFKF